jgi:hypothetical protein
MKRFKVQMTVIWYEDYNWEKSEHEYYDSEEEYIEATTASILEDGPERMNTAELDYSEISVEVVQE